MSDWPASRKPGWTGFPAPLCYRFGRSVTSGLSLGSRSEVSHVQSAPPRSPRRRLAKWICQLVHIRKEIPIQQCCGKPVRADESFQLTKLRTCSFEHTLYCKARLGRLRPLICVDQISQLLRTLPCPDEFDEQASSLALAPTSGVSESTTPFKFFRIEVDRVEVGHVASPLYDTATLRDIRFVGTRPRRQITVCEASRSIKVRFRSTPHA